MQRRMVGNPLQLLNFALTTSNQLSKEDEASTGGNENEVRREDQEKINRFSRLHQREAVLEDILKGKRVRTFSPLFISEGREGGS